MVNDDTTVIPIVYSRYVCLSVANMEGTTFFVTRGGSLVDFTNFVRRGVGSNFNIASLIERFNQCARQLLIFDFIHTMFTISAR